MKPEIPFHKPYTGTDEEQAVCRVLQSGVLRGEGPVSRRLQETICRDIGAGHVFLTTSCTHALEISLMALDITAGDEVIMPSFTFVSSANAALLCGATPVFADIDRETLNIDIDDVARKITGRTKAVIPVHYAGVSVDMNALKEVTDHHNIPVIEDAAQAVGAMYHDTALGTLGLMGCFSFHDTKNLTCGEGGAIMTDDEQVARKIEYIREKGTNRSAFLRGEVDRYTWVERGSSYILSDLLAGILGVQWEKRGEIRTLREKAWKKYHQILEPMEQNGWIRRPVIPEYAVPNYHIYYFTTCREKDRDPLLKALKKAGIHATFHYVPLHTSPYGRSIGADRFHLPQTDRLSASLIRLPLYPGIHQEHPDVAGRAGEVLQSFFSKS